MFLNIVKQPKAFTGNNSILVKTPTDINNI